MNVKLNWWIVLLCLIKYLQVLQWKHNCFGHASNLDLKKGFKFEPQCWLQLKGYIVQVQVQSHGRTE